MSKKSTPAEKPPGAKYDSLVDPDKKEDWLAGKIPLAEALGRRGNEHKTFWLSAEEPASEDTNMIEKLYGMEDGWLDGEGLAPSKEGLDWLKGVYERFADKVPKPYFYPTPEGNVQAEWSATKWDLTATFDLKRRKVKLFATSNVFPELFFVSMFDLSTEEEEAKFLDDLGKSYDLLEKPLEPAP